MGPDDKAPHAMSEIEDPHDTPTVRSRSMAPGVPSVLQIRGFRQFWIASLISNCGSWLQTVAAGYLVYHLTHSPGMVGALALVSRGPAFLLSTTGGGLPTASTAAWSAAGRSPSRGSRPRGWP